MSTSKDEQIPDGAPSDAEQVARQEYEMEVIRENLDGLIRELDMRRHAWAPSRLLRKVPRPLLLAGLGAVGLGAGFGIWQWQAHNSRRRNSWVNRAKRLGLAARRAIDAPDDVAKTSPNVPKKLATTVAVAVVGILTRRFLGAYLARDRA